MSCLETDGSCVLGPCWSWQPFMLTKRPLSYKYPVVLLLPFCASLLSSWNSLLLSLLFALKCQRLPSELYLVPCSLLCKHVLELQNVCLSYLEIFQPPTNILDLHSSSHTLCSPCISFYNFADLTFTCVVLSCPFSISSDFNFIRNLPVSPTTYALLSHVLHSPFLCIICPSDIFSFHNLLVILLFPFLPFPGLPQDTPHYIASLGKKQNMV